MLKEIFNKLGLVKFIEINNSKETYTYKFKICQRIKKLIYVILLKSSTDSDNLVHILTIPKTVHPRSLTTFSAYWSNPISARVILRHNKGANCKFIQSEPVGIKASPRVRRGRKRRVRVTRRANQYGNFISAARRAAYRIKYENGDVARAARRTRPRLEFRRWPDYLRAVYFQFALPPRRSLSPSQGEASGGWARAN